MTYSDRYAVAAAIALLFLLLFDNAIAMLIIGSLGLLAGLVIVWRSSLRRSGILAAVAFAVVVAFAVFTLVH